jgi:TatD DNase family protein
MNPGRGKIYIDFHTHRQSADRDTLTIMNLMAGEDVPADFPENTLFSAGIHPWQLTGDNHEQLQTEFILTAAHPHVVLIGEAGFDHNKGVQGELQYRVFVFQASIAAEMHKPVVIHCVRGWEELSRAYREIRPDRPWVVHGFRGSSRLAASLDDQGFWFSLGLEGISADILKAVSRDRILLETDDSGRPIAEVYRHYATTAGCSEDEAAGLIRKNFNTLLNFRL